MYVVTVVYVVYVVYVVTVVCFIVVVCVVTIVCFVIVVCMYVWICVCKKETEKKQDKTTHFEFKSLKVSQNKGLKYFVT